MACCFAGVSDSERGQDYSWTPSHAICSPRTVFTNQEGAQLAEEYLNKEDIPDDNLHLMMWNKPILVLACSSGVTRVQHSPLMIRFCLALNRRVGTRYWSYL